MKFGLLLSTLLVVDLSSLSFAQSTTMKIIRFDPSGGAHVQAAVETKSVVTPQGSVFISTASKLNAQAQPVLSRQTTATTTQPSAGTRHSESVTQVRDAAGNLKRQSKTSMTETRVASDTVQTETLFQESRSSEMITTARMHETRKEFSDGSQYQRTIEARNAEGEFRPKQKVEAQTRNFSDGSSRTRTLESAVDLNGNVHPTRETTERQSPELWGKQSVERIIKTIEASGEAKLNRVEQEERNPHATSGVVEQKVVKQPDSSYGLRETKIVTTSMSTDYTGAPCKTTVTKAYPRNDRFGAPDITQVEIEKTVRRPDGTSYVERELKVRDVNGNLSTLSVVQVETKNDGR